MKRYLVTVKLPKNPYHDPYNKVVGGCPFGGGECTDATGEHHTIFVESDMTAAAIRDALSGQYHVTRVEEVRNTISVSR